MPFSWLNASQPYELCLTPDRHIRLLHLVSCHRLTQAKSALEIIKPQEQQQRLKGKRCFSQLVPKHETGNMAQPTKLPIFEQAHVEMCAQSRPVSTSAEFLTDVKERVYLSACEQERKNCRGKTAAASLSITFKGWPGVSDSGRIRWSSLQYKLHS